MLVIADCIYADGVPCGMVSYMRITSPDRGNCNEKSANRNQCYEFASFYKACSVLLDNPSGQCSPSALCLQPTTSNWQNENIRYVCFADSLL